MPLHRLHLLLAAHQLKAIEQWILNLGYAKQKIVQVTIKF
jgi:hypothetical protein